MFDNDPKVAVITGASQGLGEGFVNVYRERGYRVVGNPRTIAPSTDPDYLTVLGDVGEPPVARSVVETALAHFGRIDTWINNAGIWRAAPITDISEDLYRRMMATNLDSVFFATQAAVAAMQKQGSGHILQVSTSELGRARPHHRAGGIGLAVQGRRRRRDPRPGDGSGTAQYQRGVAGHHQHPCTTRTFWRTNDRSPHCTASARSVMSCAQCSTSKTPTSSPGKSPTSTAAAPPGTDTPPTTVATRPPEERS